MQSAVADSGAEAITPLIEPAGRAVRSMVGCPRISNKHKRLRSDKTLAIIYPQQSRVSK